MYDVLHILKAVKVFVGSIKKVRNGDGTLKLWKKVLVYKRPAVTLNKVTAGLFSYLSKCYDKHDRQLSCLSCYDTSGRGK